VGGGCHEVWHCYLGDRWLLQPRNITPKVSGAGWLAYCTKLQRKLFGYFFGFSSKAESYRGELLELLAIHTLIATLEAYYLLGEATGNLCFDNQDALHKSKEVHHRIPVGPLHVYIKHAFCNVQHGMYAKLDYEWGVESHQDCYKVWWQLSPEQQLNCICDQLAKEAVCQSFDFSERSAPQIRLPCKSAAVFIAGMKQLQTGCRVFVSSFAGWQQSAFTLLTWVSDVLMAVIVQVGWAGQRINSRRWIG